MTGAVSSVLWLQSTFPPTFYRSCCSSDINAAAAFSVGGTDTTAGVSKNRVEHLKLFMSEYVHRFHLFMCVSKDCAIQPQLLDRQLEIAFLLCEVNPGPVQAVFPRESVPAC